MAKDKPTRKPAWRWWQVPCRVAITLVLLLGTAYAALPWWAPRDYIRHRLAADLAAQMGVPVRIDELHMSWGAGVEIRRLTIAAPSGAGPEPLVAIRSLRTEFAPIKLLFQKRLGWVELVGPVVNICVDDQGGVSTAPLTRLKQDLTVDRLAVHQGRVVVRLAGDSRAVSLRITSFLFDAGSVQDVAMSGALEQTAPAGEALVSLSPGAGSSAATAASAAFTFSNLALEQVPLPPWLGLPIRKLSGRARGSADLKVGRDGSVEGFGLDVVIRRLDVQPAAGPMLPVVDEAGLHFQAAYDQITKALQLQNVSIRLPGLELRGQAKCFAQALDGHWEALESLDLSGRVYPERLAALLTGQARLGGEISVAGPVEVKARAAREGLKLHLELSADATAAAVRRGEQTLKPAARICRMGLSGDLDHRTSGFIVEDSWLNLSANRFQGHGALVSLRRLAERLARADGRTGGKDPASVVLAELASLDWRGSWEVLDLPALTDLAPPDMGPDAWGGVKLIGPLTGRWFLHHAAITRVHTSFSLPPEAVLRVGGHFAKPVGAAMHLDLEVGIDPNGAGVTDLAGELTVGSGRLFVERADLKLPRAPSSSSAPASPSASPSGAASPAEPATAPGGREADQTFELAGRVSAENIEVLLACVPAWEDLGRQIQGSLGGRFALRLSPSCQQVTLAAELRRTRISFEPWLTKPAGQDADLRVDLTCDRLAEPTRRNRLACTWIDPRWELRLSGTYPDVSGLAVPDNATWSVEADIADAARLPDAFAALRGPLGGARLGGRVKLAARGRLDHGALDANASCQATELSYASADGKRQKAAGVPLRLTADGRYSPGKGVALVELRSGSVDLGEGHVSLSGQAEWIPAAKADPKRPWPPSGLRNLHLDANASLPVCEAMKKLSPELADAAVRHGLGGRVALRAKAVLDGESIRLHSHLDATALGAADLLAGLPAAGAGTALARLGPLRKPVGLPAEADVDLLLPADLSSLRLKQLDARIGEVQLTADGAVDFRTGPDGLPAEAGKIAGHAAVTIARAGQLQALLAGLKPYQASGAVTVKVETTDLAAGAITHASLDANALQATVHGKRLLLNGACQVDNYVPATDEAAEEGRLLWDKGRYEEALDCLLPTIARVKVDEMEFRIGENHGWLLADLASLAAQPTGTFHVLAEYLDDRDLSEWAEGLSVPPQPPATPKPPPTPAATAPTSRPAYKLTDVQVAELRTQVRTLIRFGRKFLGRAKLTGRVSIARLHSYDVSVDQTYDIRQLELNASIDSALVKVSLSGGLDGGVKRDSYEVSLAEVNPTITCESALDHVMGEPNIQPQFAKFFPRNQVIGTLTRQERFTAPLADMLATGLDHRFPLHPVGSGKTVVIDGLTEGRAAPEFVVRVFPGLNLAKYLYRKMTAFTEYRPDGTTYNDMVFDGKDYDLYMEGITDKQNVGRYEIGLILLIAPQSAEWNHTYRQGRVPILNFQARIEGGQMHDEKVSYPWPTETMFVIFLKNNIFYRIWLTAAKNREPAR
jgi:hypothetical protein